MKRVTARICGARIISRKDYHSGNASSNGLMSSCLDRAKLHCYTPVQPFLRKLNALNKSRIRISQNLHTTGQLCLELLDGQSIKDWNHAYLRSYVEANRLSLAKSAQALTKKSSGCAFRSHHLVLVQDGKDFIVPEAHDDLNAWCESFRSPDVIATSFINLNQTERLVIQNRFHTIEEWEAMVQPFLTDHSRNLVLNVLMNFVSLDRRNFKVDKRVDLNEHVTSPLLQSFVDFLFVDQNLKVCQRSLQYYLQLCVHLNRYDLVEAAYGRAKAVVKIFGQPLMNDCLHFLGKTKYWKDTYQFYDVLKEWPKQNRVSLSASLANVAISNDDFKTGFGLIGNIFNPDKSMFVEPNIDSLVSCMLRKFSYDKDPKIWERNRGIVEHFLLTMADKEIFIHSKRAAQDLADWFGGIQNEKWEYAHLDTSDIPYRHCPFTGVQLKQKVLRDEEYIYLQKIILKEVIQRESIENTYNFPSYQDTNAKELRTFLTMVHEKGPFDIVIDGMNLYYYIHKRAKYVGSVNATGELASVWLRNLVLRREKQRGRKLNVLVVFKHHVSRETTNLFNDFSTVWYSTNDSADDPYFLYGALLSGRRCKLLTLDSLRDLHYILRTKFDYHTVNLVYKWQQIHQDLVLLKHSRTMAPQYFDVSVQRSPTTWHFPYHSKSPSPLPNKWLCLKRTDVVADRTSRPTTVIYRGRGQKERAFS